MRLGDIPDFGSIPDVTVVFTGHTVAAPFAAELLAEHGAKVVCIESAKQADIARAFYEPFGFLSEHRNQVFAALDFSTPDGADALLALLKEADVFIEGLKPGSFDGWELTDERMLEANPRLVITHVSGFGTTGDPDYVKRPSYDPIGQAFSGYMQLNGYPPPSEPLRANPYICDYATALFAAFSSLMGVMAARRTGKGEVIDVTQYESMLKLQYGYPMLYFVKGEKRLRSGNDEPVAFGLGLYECAEGYVELTVTAHSPVKALIEMLGLSEHPYFKDGTPHMLWHEDPAAKFVEARLHAFCLEHTADQMDRMCADRGIPCSKVNDIEDLANNPHVQARRSFIEWDDKRYGRLKGVGVFPRMENRPGMVWGGARDYGEDTRDLLAEAGIDQARLNMMAENGTLGPELPLGGFLVEELPRLKSEG